MVEQKIGSAEFPSTADQVPVGRQGPVNNYGVGAADDATQLFDIAAKIKPSMSMAIKNTVKKEVDDVVKNKPGWARY